jgi:uncharacterized protein YciW
VQAVIDDYRTAPIDEPLRALLAFIETAATAAWRITNDAIQEVKNAGWTDEAIYDAICVCALFNFYTTWVDASGVKSLEDYRPTGERLASDGYVPAMKPEAVAAG